MASLLGTATMAYNVLPVLWKMMNANSQEEILNYIANSSYGSFILDKIEHLCNATKMFKNRRRVSAATRGKSNAFSNIAKLKMKAMNMGGAGGAVLRRSSSRYNHNGRRAPATRRTNNKIMRGGRLFVVKDPRHRQRVDQIVNRLPANRRHLAGPTLIRMGLLR